MIDEKKLFNIHWTDSYFESMKISKKRDSCDIDLFLEYEKKNHISICNCFCIYVSQKGFFIGNDTILDVQLLNESSLITKERQLWVDSNIELKELKICLNSGSEISCLLSNDSFLTISEVGL